MDYFSDVGDDWSCNVETSLKAKVGFLIELTTYADKNIALFGLGGSGLVTAHALIAGGAQVCAYDDNPETVERAIAAGIPCKNLREVEFNVFDNLVLAPGVPLTHPQPHWSVELAQAAGVPIVGDIELFCHERRAIAPGSLLIAITGTNGKSTTTALISHILQHAGREVEMGGNIGRAVLDFDALNDTIVYVVEVSSYQIDLAPGIDADIAVLLNLSPDHLDRHGTMENYSQIKSSMVENARTAIIGVDDKWTKAILEHLSVHPATVSAVSVHCELDAGVFANGREIYHATKGIKTKVADLSDIGSLRGFHNAQNACIAWKACADAGLGNDEIQNGFDSFPGLVDRMEELGRVGDVLIVNDSKGTNAGASDMALGSFEYIYWIAGGLAKEGGIESLRYHFPKIAKAYLIGEAAANFSATLGDEVEYEISGTLDKAFAHALADAKRDNSGKAVILMSPACASFDQFPNYMVRGEKFREMVGQTDGFKARDAS